MVALVAPPVALAALQPLGLDSLFDFRSVSTSSLFAYYSEMSTDKASPHNLRKRKDLQSGPSSSPVPSPSNSVPKVLAPNSTPAPKKSKKSKETLDAASEAVESSDLIPTHKKSKKSEEIEKVPSVVGNPACDASALLSPTSKRFRKMSEDKLRQALTLRSIPFDPSADKPTLQALFLGPPPTPTSSNSPDNSIEARLSAHDLILKDVQASLASIAASLRGPEDPSGNKFPSLLDNLQKMASPPVMTGNKSIDPTDDASPSLFARLADSPSIPDLSPILAARAQGVPPYLESLVTVRKPQDLQIGNIIPVIVESQLLALYRVESTKPAVAALVHSEASAEGPEFPKRGSCDSSRDTLVLNQEGLSKLGKTDFSSSPPSRGGGGGSYGGGTGNFFFPPSNYASVLSNCYSSQAASSESMGLTAKQLAPSHKVVGNFVSRALTGLISHPGDAVFAQGQLSIYHSTLSDQQISIHDVLRLATSCASSAGLELFRFMPVSMEKGNQDNLRFCQSFRDLPAPGPIAVNFVGHHVDRAMAAAKCWISTLVVVFNTIDEVSTCWFSLVDRWATVLQSHSRSAKIVALLSDSLQARLNDTLQRAMAGIFANSLSRFIAEIDAISFSRDNLHPSTVVLNQEILLESLRIAATSLSVPALAPALAASAPASAALISLPATTILTPSTPTPSSGRAAALDFCPWFWTNFGCTHTLRKNGKPCPVAFHQALSPTQRTLLASFVTRMSAKPAYASMVARC